MKTLLYFGVFALMSVSSVLAAKPRVWVFTDVNIDAGDPDDRQSLVHMLWYADELDIVGIVPDRWEARGYEACQLAIAAYAEDHRRYRWSERGYPSPSHFQDRVARDAGEAIARFAHAALASEEPLWVLIWGNMELFGRAVRAHPEVAGRLRVISIGTDLMHAPDRQHMPASWERLEPCRQPNWNGAGRNEVFRDSRFAGMWWLESNWTYNGMFAGDEPKQIFDQLGRFGMMGRHLRDVTASEPWAQYFRVGDTPSVLFLIDPSANRNDPTYPSWAGRYARPFPRERPHYFTDDAGSIAWDYANPCKTWHLQEEVYRYSKGTLESARPAMYQALLAKLRAIYASPEEGKR